MTEQQKWAIISALWVAAIGIFLSAFKGRYQHLESKIDPAKFDTWSGKAYIRRPSTGEWFEVVTENENKRFTELDFGK